MATEDGDPDGQRTPVTPAGAMVAIVGAVAWLAAWRLGWIQLAVVAAGCAVALVVAVPFVVGRLRVEVRRTLHPHRVVQGERATVALEVRNPSGRRLVGRTIEDRIGNRLIRMVVTGRGDPTTLVRDLPTERRGRFSIGPALAVRSDPLGLLRRAVVQAPLQHFWVHPIHRPVTALPVGFAKDLEGPTSDTSPAGDVAFHNLREYQVGDDTRHVHWLSTARTGTVMVRHYVDNRRPNLGVVLDTRSGSYGDPAAFEVGVQAAASLAVSSTRHGQPVVVAAGGEVLYGRLAAASGADALDRLSEVELGDGLDLRAAAAHLRGVAAQVSAVVLITGTEASASDLVSAANVARGLGRVVVVRVGAGGQVALPRVRVLTVATLDDFVRLWKRVVT